ncbi:beta-galactosidase [Leifsonia sp. YAF41]|uniref:beta-galactosidase n=1 Tax=Leifsonia sp. YAF41 TaxID=3233086 RepID=UPI003F973B53
MKDVTVKNGLLQVGDRSLPLIAGEIQFWRMEPDTWARAIEEARDAGVTVVSTYLSWRRHEPRQGEVDFEGTSDPRLDVRRFLRACSDAGVYVQIKPGPWICAEEPGGGYPDWLLENDLILALDDEGQVVIGYNPPFQHPVPSYTDPTYLRAVRRWFTQVWEAIGDFAYPHGPIVAIQLDNEPSSCFQDSLYGADYSESSVAAFRGWLTDKYSSDIDLLRRAWDDQQITSFLTAVPPSRPTGERRSDSRRHLHDWIEFKTAATGAYLAELGHMHSGCGVGHLLSTVNLVTHPIHDVPVSHASIRAAANASTGEDHYYIPPLDTADIHRLARSAATARSAGEPLAWVPELQAGIWRSPGEVVDYPDPTPLEQEIWWGAAIAYGFQGFNFYMLADRENWEFSPLRQDSSHSDFFTPIERIVAVAGAGAAALTNEAKAVVVVAWHRPDAYDAYTVVGTSRIPGVEWFDDEAYRAYQEWDQTLQHLTTLGLLYDLWDTETDLSADPDAPLIVPAHSTIDPGKLDSIRALGRRVIELDPTSATHVLASLVPFAPHVVVQDGSALPQTLVGVRDGAEEEYVHVVHWGTCSEEATIVLPGRADGTLTDILTSATFELLDERVLLPITPGHHTFVLTSTTAAVHRTTPDQGGTPA